MDAIRCESCNSVWLNYIARELIELSGKCLRCDGTHLVETTTETEPGVPGPFQYFSPSGTGVSAVAIKRR